MKTKLNSMIALLLSGWMITSTSCQKTEDFAPSNPGMVYEGSDIQPASYDDDYNAASDDEVIEAVQNPWTINPLTQVKGTLENLDSHQVISDPGAGTFEEVLGK